MGNYRKKVSIKTKLPLGREGFMTVFFICLLSLSLTGFFIILSLSLSLKNKTYAQSLCLKITKDTQDSLGENLKKLLTLNKKSRALHKKRKSLKKAKILALASVIGSAGVAPIEASIKLTKSLQVSLIARQKALIAKSYLLRLRHFQKFKSKLKKRKGFQIKKEFPKKALPVKKEKIGKLSYIYKPLENLKEKQKIRYFFKVSPLFPLESSFFKLLSKNKKLFKKGIPGSCTMSLEKKGGAWQSFLYH